MTEKEILERIKRNIFNLGFGMMDAPYFGFSGDKVRGVHFAIEKILEGTGITEKDIINEFIDKERDAQ
jgi:hypothetical protein